MSIDVRLKHSSVANKAPTAGDLTEGELALNINAGSPAAYIKDSAGAIVKIAGEGAVGVDGKYLSLDAAAGGQTVASTGTTTFNGLVEAGAGVKVTGGDILVEAGSVTAKNSPTGQSFNSTFGGTYTTNLVGLFASATVGTSAKDVYGVQISANLSNNTTASGSVYGVSSSVADGTNKYNFYAAGTAPNYSKGKLHFATNTNNLLSAEHTRTEVRTGAVDVVHASTIPDTSACISLYKNSGSGAVNARYLALLANTGAAGAANVEGYLGLNASNEPGLFNLSDYRVKSNITPLPDSAELIKQLSPCSFTKGGVNNIRGFIAHELQQVCPEAVSGTQDATEEIGTLHDHEGNLVQSDVPEPPIEELEYTIEIDGDAEDDGGEHPKLTKTVSHKWTKTGTRPVYQAVDQTKLIPLLTKALQEALERIEALEAAIAKA